MEAEIEVIEMVHDVRDYRQYIGFEVYVHAGFAAKNWVVLTSKKPTESSVYCTVPGYDRPKAVRKHHICWDVARSVQTGFTASFPTLNATPSLVQSEPTIMGSKHSPSQLNTLNVNSRPDVVQSNLDLVSLTDTVREEGGNDIRHQRISDIEQRLAVQKCSICKNG